MKLFVLAAMVMLAGCATLPRNAGFEAVRAEVDARLGQPVHWRQGTAEDAAVDAEVARLLAAPLTADAAVQVALLNNRQLQAEYETLGVAQADLVQAGLLANPGLGWLRQEGGDMAKTKWGLELNFLSLLLRAPRERLEALRFAHVQLGVAQAVLRHAAETRKSWLEAVAAEQLARFMAQVADLAAAEAELGERQRKAGNLNRRDALRQQAFATETMTALQRARLAAQVARERLARLMGTESATWQLPERLPMLPQVAPPTAGLEDYGVRQRLDLQMAQREVEALAASLKITRDSRFVNVLNLGVETEKSTGERRITGPTLRFELPLFDQGQARVSRQEALYRQGEARLSALVADARAEIRAQAARVAMTYLIARQYRDALVPLRRHIVEQSLLHYNGMLIGVYELLADARAQIDAVQADISATRDFWLALADLQLALGGRLPDALAEPQPETPPVAVPIPSHHHEEHAP